MTLLPEAPPIRVGLWAKPADRLASLDPTLAEPRIFALPPGAAVSQCGGAAEKEQEKGRREAMGK